MGKRMIAEVTCDLTGETLSADAEATTLYVNGTMATLFLSETGKAKLDKALAPFFKVGEVTENVQTVVKRAPVSGNTSVGSAFPELDDVEPAEIRAWAEANGFTVAPQGRIRNEVLSEYVRRVINGENTSQNDTPESDSSAA